MNEFIASAASRETSVEIMQAIADLAHGNVDIAERIWDCPSDGEMLAVWEIVTKNGLLPADAYYWGAAGDQWADEI